MKKHKRSLMDKSIVVGLVVWLTLGIGFGAAQTSTITATGKLNLTLEPSFDGKGDIRATSITTTELFRKDINGTVTTVTGAAAGFKALFNLSGIAPGDYFIRVNNLADTLIPTRIDDPTKDINQFVGENLRVSIIGNLSDPTYQIKVLGVPSRVWCSDGTAVAGGGTSVYIIQSLKTKPQKLEIKYVVLPSSELANITDYTPSAPIHPSTMTSINPPFSKWLFGEGSHGVDYGGNDSKCSTCHGNLDTKPTNLDTNRDNFTDIPVNNGFCFRCHYGKSGTDAGFVGEPGCLHPYPAPQFTAAATTAKPTAGSTTTTPKTPDFEALFAISALLITVLVRRRQN